MQRMQTLRNAIATKFHQTTPPSHETPAANTELSEANVRFMNRLNGSRFQELRTQLEDAGVDIGQINLSRDGMEVIAERMFSKVQGTEARQALANQLSELFFKVENGEKTLDIGLPEFDFLNSPDQPTAEQLQDAIRAFQKNWGKNSGDAFDRGMRLIHDDLCESLQDFHNGLNGLLYRKSDLKTPFNTSAGKVSKKSLVLTALVDAVDKKIGGVRARGLTNAQIEQQRANTRSHVQSPMPHSNTTTSYAPHGIVGGYDREAHSSDDE